MKLHSMVGLITNSSTEIFSWATAQTVARFKDAINSLLFTYSDNINFDDIFRIEIEPSDVAKDYWNEMDDEEKSKYGTIENYIEEYNMMEDFKLQNTVRIYSIESGERASNLELLLPGVYHRASIENY